MIPTPVCTYIIKHNIRTSQAMDGSIEVVVVVVVEIGVALGTLF